MQISALLLINPPQQHFVYRTEWIVCSDNSEIYTSSHIDFSEILKYGLVFCLCQTFFTLTNLKTNWRGLHFAIPLSVQDLQVVSFLHVFQPKLCMHFFWHTCHMPSPSHWITVMTFGKECTVSHYVIFPSFLPLPHFLSTMFYGARSSFK